MMANERDNWSQPLKVCGACCDVADENSIGCLGRGPAPPEVITITGSAQLSGFDTVSYGHTRISIVLSTSMDHSGLTGILDAVKESNNVGKSFLTLFPNQASISQHDFRPFIVGLQNQYQAFLTQSSSTWDPQGTIVGLSPLVNNCPLQIRHLRPGKLLGGVAYHEVYDESVGGQYICSIRMGVLVASSFTMPTDIKLVQEYHKSFTIGGLEAFTTPALLREVTTKRVKEVKERVNKSRKTNTPVLVMIASDLFEHTDKFLKDDCLLEMVPWGNFHVYFSPVIAHMLDRLTVADNVLLFDFNTERVKNASGVLCCISDVCNKRRYGWGAPLYEQDKNFRHSHRCLQYLDNFHNSDGLLTLPETGVVKKLPEGRADTVAAVNSLKKVESFVAFDMEYNPNTKMLGTLAFCYRDQDKANLVLLLIRKQVLGDDVFEEEVVPMLKDMLHGRMNLRLTTFDFKSDKLALVKNEIVGEGEVLHGVIDLKTHQQIGACFRLMYLATGEQSVETALGLAQFVSMTKRLGLCKVQQKSAWDTEVVQKKDENILYALLDVYAIHCVVEYYESDTGEQLFEGNNLGGAP